MVANALVSSRLDCFAVCPPKNITRLQNIQNCLVSFVSRASKFSYVTPIIKSLHWLPVKQRIKTLLLILPLASQNTVPHICLYIHLLLKQDVVIEKSLFQQVLLI